MTIEQRLNRLERQNRRLKFGGIVALLGIGAVFLMGQAKGVPEEIRAKSLVIVDDDDRVRARLGANELLPEHTELMLTDASGVMVAYLRAGEHPFGASLDLLDQYGARISLRAVKDGAALGLNSAIVGGGQISMLAGEGGAGLELGFSRPEATDRTKQIVLPAPYQPGITLDAYLKDGASVRLHDENGNRRATLGVEDLINPKTEVETRRPENSLVLFNADGEVVHEVP